MRRNGSTASSCRTPAVAAQDEPLQRRPEQLRAELRQALLQERQHEVHAGGVALEDGERREVVDHEARQPVGLGKDEPRGLTGRPAAAPPHGLPQALDQQVAPGPVVPGGPTTRPAISECRL